MPLLGTGNGTITALDASLILQQRVGLISSFPVAQTCGSDWVFVPVPEAASNQQTVPPEMRANSCQMGAILFTPLAAQADGQDFLGVRFGDCNGSWQPLAGGGATAP